MGAKGCEDGARVLVAQTLSVSFFKATWNVSIYFEGSQL